MILFGIAWLYTSSTIAASSSSSTVQTESKESAMREIGTSQVLPIKGVDLYLHQVDEPESSGRPIATRCSAMASYCNETIVGRTILVASSANIEKLTLVHENFLNHIGDFRKFYCEEQDKKNEAQTREILGNCMEDICSAPNSEDAKRTELIAFINKEAGSSEQKGYAAMSIDELVNLVRSQPTNLTSTFEEVNLSDLVAESEFFRWLLPLIRSFEAKNNIEMTAIAKTASDVRSHKKAERLKKCAMSDIVDCSLYFCYRMHKSRSDGVVAPLVQCNFGIPFSTGDYSQEIVPGILLKPELENFLLDVKQRNEKGGQQKPYTADAQAVQKYLSDVVELDPAYQKGVMLIRLVNEPGLKDKPSGDSSDLSDSSDY